MKKLTVLFALLCTATWLLSALPASAQDSKIVVLMTDGTQKEGYLRSAFHSGILHLDLSDEPTGDMERLPAGRIEQVTFRNADGTETRFVKDYYFRLTGGKKKYAKKRPLLFRVDYEGQGIKLLTELREEQETRGLHTFIKKERWYYAKIDGEPAAKTIGGETLDGNNMREVNTFKTFAKRTFKDCPDLIRRIDNNEFSIKDPVALIKAYEQMAR